MIILYATEDIQLMIYRVMWYQHNGCLAHYGRRVIATLNKIFPNRWIGREPISWPARSPDIISFDFFLRKTLKKHCTSGNADYTRKYEATNYCSM